VVLAGAALMPVGYLAPGVGAEALKVAALLAFATALFVCGALGRDELTEVRDLARRFSRRPAPTA
jgi:hypothetical protein